MKKLFAALLIALLALSACAPSPGEAEAPEESAEAFALRPLLKRETRYGVGAYNSRGIYDYEQQYPNEYTEYNKLCYTDFESAARRACCDIEGCAHNAPGCAAWHRWPTDGQTVLPTENELIWIQNTMYFTDEIAPEKISVSGLDGLNLRALKTFEPNTILDINIANMYYDGEYLYYFVYQLRDGGVKLEEFVSGGARLDPDYYKDNYEWRFVKLSLASGEEAFSAPVETPEGYEYSSLETRGNIGDKLVYSFLNFEPNVMEAKLAGMKFFAVSPETGESEFIREFDYSGEAYQYNAANSRVTDGKLYSRLSDKTGWFEIDLESGEETRLFDITADTSDWDAFWRLDGHYIVTTRNDDEVDYSTEPKYVDYEYIPETGELKKLELGYFNASDWNGGWTLIRPLAITEDEYYVCSFSETVEENYYYGATIMPVPREREIKTMAMISKADYWSGTPNYRDIKEAE